MPSWWGKSSSKDGKKEANNESFLERIRKFKILSEEKWINRSKGSRRKNIPPEASQSRVESQSTSPSAQVSRCQSFNQWPQGHPLPLPPVSRNSLQPNDDVSSKQCSRSLSPLPLPRLGDVKKGIHSAEVETDIATSSSGSSTDIDDPSDSRLLSPQASDYEYGNKMAINSPSSTLKDIDHFPIATRKKSANKLKPSNILSNSQTVPTSPNWRSLRTCVPNLQIPPHGAFRSAPDSSKSSPSQSPNHVFYPHYSAGKPHTDLPLMGSGHCSSPGSGQNSAQNSVGGDVSAHLFWQQNYHCSPERSPIQSPRMTSPGPGSRIQSGAVTPFHPRAAGESTGNWANDGKNKSHRLPLPPLSTSRTCPLSLSYSTGTAPSVPRSPSCPENPASPGSRWKKGRLLVRGTFGHVYLGFNSESGEMCAMKEVTLLSDDAKSKESAQQLGQEIVLLSRLRHPNIVQYYGSETVDDKLYIYLEYVAGGSIYRILQDYGQLGEVAIRSYTKQILSGLAYLHEKNTVHRDIKGANILVDPNGCVKLADFGMAKHISGYTCPLSFKGSPYWMAPEVININNSSGCNLAVDIWSLGCTVLEMATTKPPWSQYEGVAALFKIGNSKDIPVIPDHLSDEGKDFVRQCLQRDPAHRPTAAKLLDHPFVRNAVMLERPFNSPDPPSEALSSVAKSIRSRGFGRARNLMYLDTKGVSMHQSRGHRISDAHMPQNKSCPVSPTRSPLLHSRSPQDQSGRLSPSPISSPHTMSGSSTPLAGGPSSIPLYNNPMPPPITTISRSQNLYYRDPKPDIFKGMPQASPLFWDPSENDFLVNKNFYDGQSVLANRVSQQLLKDHVKTESAIRS